MTQSDDQSDDQSHDHPLDHYETALLTELRTYVAERQVTTLRPRRTKRRLAYIGVAAAAAAGIAVVTLPGGPTASPAAAYSTVSVAPSGSVHVEVSNLDDSETLEQVLADHGVAADVAFLQSTQVCDAARYAGYVEGVVSRVVVSQSDDGFAIDLAGVPGPGETLLIDTGFVGVVSGDVPECVPVTAPTKG
jgi:hypothetical protein